MTPEQIEDDLIESTCSKVNDGRSLGLNHIGELLDAIKHLRAKVEAADEVADLLEEVQRQGCEICNGDCAGAYPSVGYCPMQARTKALTAYREAGQ